MDHTPKFTDGPTNTYEIALQSICKQLLKSRLFRGFYVERHYAENIEDYRDIVGLHKSEKDLSKLLRNLRDKLRLFYSQQNSKIWIGITTGPLAAINTPPIEALQIYLWVELKDIAFGQYWFSIKNVRFRQNEVLLKLREVRPIEEEITPICKPIKRCNKSIHYHLSESVVSSLSAPTTTYALENQLTFDDFMLLLRQWWASIKQSAYNFMAQDITKDNAKAFARFLGLLMFSVLSGILEGVKFLGIFTLRFMNEISRLITILTPIICKIIELFNNMIGGFYVLLTMIWKDAVVNRNQPKHNLKHNHHVYKMLKQEVTQRKLNSMRSPNID